MRAIMFIVFSILLALCIMPFHINAMSGEEAPSAKAETGIILKTDDKSINKGKEIFDSKCGFCHQTNSTKKGVGPGLKGIMKGDKTLVSNKPSTPENIIDQLKNPYQNMPSFSSLSEEDILNVIAYLNTL